MANSMKKYIVVFAYSRAKLLKKCLNSLKAADDINSWKVIIVYQEGDSEVLKVINGFDEFVDTLIKIKARFKKPLANLNYSRILGTNFAFEILNADYVLGLEEDTIISKDALSFIDFVHEKYKGYRAYRGVNLGSLEPRIENEAKGYSLIRFGLHGQAGVITRKTWRHIKSKNLFELSADVGWDSNIEFYLKSGFMVTPNLSRDLDFGWGGTHAPLDSMHPHYVKMRESWIGENKHKILDYERIDVNHSWRKDAISYNPLVSFVFMIRGSKLFVLYQNMFKTRNWNNFLDKDK